MVRLDFSKHPCFNIESKPVFGRIHLPIAGDCNIQCNFCNRKYACVNENRPGVTSAILTPEQSICYLERIMSKKSNITVVGIAGPGEAFANPDDTLKTLRLVRKKFPDVLLCIATNGLNILSYLDELRDLEVSHVTITVNAVKPEFGARIYSWVRFKNRLYRGIEAAALLRDRQIEAIKGLKERKIMVKINTIIIPGINDTHVIDVAKEVSGAGADILNCMPLYPSKDTIFENIKEPTVEQISEIRRNAIEYIPQMCHCRRCRADAAGLLEEELTDELVSTLKECSQLPANLEDDRSCVAIATMEGILVNQHLGEAQELWIYKRTDGRFRFLEKRKTPEPGGGVMRWLDLANILPDCCAILVSGVGHTPKEILYIKGIHVVETEGIIEEIFNGLSHRVSLNHLQKKETGCSFGCSGGGRGCE